MGSRTLVLQAARELFVEQTPAAISVEDVRRRSGVSTGSIYHHFPRGKESLVSAVFAEELQRHHDDVLSVVAAHQQLSSGVRAGVEHFLAWVEGSPDRARLLLSLEDLAGSNLDATLASLADRFGARLHDWLMSVTGHDPAVPSLDLVFCVWIGPAKEYARAWLTHRALTPPTHVTGALADAADAGVVAAVGSSE